MFQLTLLALSAFSAPLPAAAQPCTDDERPALSGTVRDVTTNVPLVGANVSLTWRGTGDRRDRTDTATSDGAGAFRFCGVPDGQRVQVGASYGYGSATPVSTVTGDGVTVELTLRAPLSVLTGRISAGDGALDAAAVRLTGTPLEVLTTADGRFRFEQVPAGRYELTVSSLGYAPVRASVTVEMASTVAVDVRMAADPVALEPITVSTRSFHLERVGFYDRQERMSGAFITRDRIAAVQPRYASDFLRGVAGIRMAARRDFGHAPIGRGNCGFRYVVDGARIGEGFEIDDIMADAIEAIEIYRGPAEVPGQFSAGPGTARANCGVIVVWTRAR